LEWSAEIVPASLEGRDLSDDRLKTAESRQQRASSRQKTADKRQETADRRQQTGDGRQETADSRQQTGDRRQETGYRHRSKGAFSPMIFSKHARMWTMSVLLSLFFFRISITYRWKFVEILFSYIVGSEVVIDCIRKVVSF
jgi:hypothetical protein